MSQLTKQLKNHLLNYFKQLLQTQASIEHQKKQNLKVKGYNYRAIFYKISKKQEFISIKLMRDYLHNKVACNQRQLYSIFQRFDHYQQGRIYQEDFKIQFIKDIKTKSGKKSKKYKNIDGKYYDGEVRHEAQAAFIKLINLHLKTVRVLDVWRKQLSIVSPYIFFKHLDRHLTGFIGPLDLTHFFILNNSQLNHQKTQILFKILKKCSANLNLQVFCQNISPVESGYYNSYNYEYNKLKSQQFLQKQTKYKQAKEQQQNYYRQRNNDIIVEQIHRQAALRRQKQIEDKIADQIKIYNNVKYQTLLKYRPGLTYQTYMEIQKQNRINNEIKIKQMQASLLQKQSQYKNKMIKVQALRDIQLYKLSRNDYLLSQRASSNYLHSDNNKNMHTARQLQDRIRLYRQDKLIDLNKNRLLFKNQHMLKGNNLTFI